MKVIVIFFCLALWSAAKEGVSLEQKTDFLRVEESEKFAKLQTAVTIYEKDGARVSLIGAVHLADRSYYQALNEEFTQYDCLLFEMIGGERMGEQQQEKVKKDPLAKIYQIVARLLKLADQKKEIDYSPGNFVHADLSFAEFNALQKERGESLFSIAMESGKTMTPQKQPDLGKILRAIVTGKPHRVKLELMGVFGDGDEQIDALLGESVIIADRNAKCLEVLAEQLEAGHRQLGIFYGAAHFPEMERSLLKQGYRKVAHEWRDAWTVKKGS